MGLCSCWDLHTWEMELRTGMESADSKCGVPVCGLPSTKSRLQRDEWVVMALDWGSGSSMSLHIYFIYQYM